jgi:hypothetical protein
MRVKYLAQNATLLYSVTRPIVSILQSIASYILELEVEEIALLNNLRIKLYSVMC